MSNTLNVSITELLTGEQAKMHVYSVTRAGKGVDVERSSAYKYRDLAHNFADRRVSPFLVTIAPSGDDEPYHLNVHTGHEYHYCLEGAFKIKIDNTILEIHEGDSLYFDSGHPHGMKAIGGNLPTCLSWLYKLGGKWFDRTFLQQIRLFVLRGF